MQYSKFTRNQANYLFKRWKSGDLKANSTHFNWIYKEADARMIHDDTWQDIEDKLKLSISEFSKGNHAAAQRAFDSAVSVHDRHFEVKKKVVKKVRKDAAAKKKTVS